MMTMQLPSKRRFRTPGPGAYNVSGAALGPSPPAFTMGGKEFYELLAPLDWEPGPGTYAASAHRTRRRDGPAITIGPRVPAASCGRYSRDAPGPGAYNVGAGICSTRPREPSFSIAPRPQSFRRELSPGPGSYCVGGGGAEARGPAFSIAARLRSKLLFSEPPGDSGGPGPGAYNAAAAADDLRRPRSPVISIAGGGRRKIPAAAPDPDVPGPGAYGHNAAKPALHARAFALSGRPPAKPADDSPGPGQYAAEAAEPLTHPSEPAFSIAGRLSHSSNAAPAAGGGGGGGSDSAAPGPGSYEPRDRAKRTPAFTIAGKPHDARPAPFVATHAAVVGKGNPGPGAYLGPGVAAGHSSPAIRIAGKNYSAPGDVVPGPGAYSPRDGGIGEHRQGITIGPRLSTSGCGSQSVVVYAAEPSPGPGNYFWDNRYYCSMSSAPAISMGIRFPVPRGLAAAAAAGDAAGPGPGSYNLNTLRRNGPAFSINSGSERYSFS